MKLFALRHDGTRFVGIDDGRGMIDLTRAVALHAVESGLPGEPPITSIDDIIASGRCTVAYLGTVLETVARLGIRSDVAIPASAEVTAPLAPGKIIALGQNYREHARELGDTIPDRPVLFGKWPSVAIGPGEPIVIPPGIGRVDHEAELALVIGRTARNIRPGDARAHICGYTCLNDVTARGMQFADRAKSLPWMVAKNYETFCPMGPCVLVADAPDTPEIFDIRGMVNGEVRQHGSTADFIFDIPGVIAYISEILALHPGDVITTGTPSGVGPIVPGDRVEITCEHIGTLTNPVVAADPGP